MKVVANAGVLAKALALAASLENSKTFKTFAAAEVVNVSTGESTVTLSRNILESQITLTIPAVVERAGALAMPSDRLAALAAGFPAEATITIQVEGAGARIRSGRSVYKLPVIPATNLPLELAVPREGADGVELSRDQVAALFAPSFCTAHDERTYIAGVYIHDSAAGLISCGTNGHSLVQHTLRGITGFGSAITVPNAAIKKPSSSCLPVRAPKPSHCGTPKRRRRCSRSRHRRVFS
jgi:DNA polymerase-3 subunit beta